MNTYTPTLTIEKLTPIYEEQAKTLILNGFLDYFEEIDHSLNPDVYELMKCYSKPQHVFLVGLVNGKVVSTGGLMSESHSTGRIVRMSVDKNFRRSGFASKMLAALEQQAMLLQMTTLLIETNAEWDSPIRLYKKFGYQITGLEEERIHFRKQM